ncbi:type 1 glutamine amidotransferase domain-containing protein [Sediminibacterium soli]|uniref:type 1 glutamine amidotransferase domain-containing protein n=1 Tax=Sediminibacterium soli TaxID=2698829 RepID=UPI00137A2F38|nr:type 1 glutamine amidotransferase domain-containing protein [Sediminibacterium soli]NCI45913.1 type 1 glutamine amidotransferase [Sediminibacterium soli]
MKKITGKKVAILTEDGFEEVELTSPKKALEEAGAMVYIVSPQKNKVKAWAHDHWSIDLPVDIQLDEANPNNYDALVLPGGVMNPDKLRQNKKAVAFARGFLDLRKPVAAICHGPQLLIETGRLNGVNLTSYPSLQTDLVNAGAHWEDREMICDKGLITSRSPKDLDAFNSQLLKVLADPATAGEKDATEDSLTFKYSQSM